MKLKNETYYTRKHDWQKNTWTIKISDDLTEWVLASIASQL